MSRKKINIRTKKLGIGPRLKKYRISKGLKVEELGKLIGVAHGTISNTENEVTTVSAETLQKICRNTNINPLWLITGKGQMTQKKGIKYEFEKPKVSYIGAPSGVEAYGTPSIDQLLSMAREILESGMSYGTSLAVNIQSFHEAMETRRKLMDHEKRLGALEGKDSRSADSEK